MLPSRIEWLPYLLAANIINNCVIYLVLALWPGTAIETIVMGILGLVISVLTNIFFILFIGVISLLFWGISRLQRKRGSRQGIYPGLRDPQQRLTALLALGLCLFNACALSGVIMASGGGMKLILPFWILVIQLGGLHFFLKGKNTCPPPSPLWSRRLIATIVGVIIASTVMGYLQLPFKAAFAVTHPQLARLATDYPTRTIQERLNRFMGPFYITEYQAVANEAVYFVQRHPYRAAHLGEVSGFAFGVAVTPPPACRQPDRFSTLPIAQGWQYFTC
jgi:FtsH-binding integral membrane protein